MFVHTCGPVIDNRALIALAEDLAREGAICVRDAIDPEWMRTLDDGFWRNIDSRRSELINIDLVSDFVMDSNCWMHVPEYIQFVKESPTASLVGALSGANELNVLDNDLLWNRHPQSIPTPWHQDCMYYDLAGHLYSLWIPLDSVEELASLVVVRASHKWGRRFSPADFSGSVNDILETVSLPQDVEPPFNPDKEESGVEFMRWEMARGDAILFDGRAVHGRGAGIPCGSSLRRLTFRFVTEDARWLPSAYPWTQLRMKPGELSPGERLSSPSFPLVWKK